MGRVERIVAVQNLRRGGGREEKRSSYPQMLCPTFGCHSRPRPAAAAASPRCQAGVFGKAAANSRVPSWEGRHLNPQGQKKGRCSQGRPAARFPRGGAAATALGCWTRGQLASGVPAGLRFARPLEPVRNDRTRQAVVYLGAVCRSAAMKGGGEVIDRAKPPIVVTKHDVRVWEVGEGKSKPSRFEVWPKK